jgi:hypothetical protein
MKPSLTIQPVTFPPVALAELRGGPYNGRRFKVKAGSVRLHLSTRRKTGPKDRPSVAIYAREAGAGPLAYRETIGDKDCT